jgi:geranylgeranyl pyrophosphate synthase
MLHEELKKVKKEVDEFLKSFFEEKKNGIGSVHEEVEKIIENIEDMTLRGGDRFRPFMCYLGWLVNQNVVNRHPEEHSDEGSSKQILRFTQNDELNNDILKIMSCTELLQTFALIHDDIIDKAEMRRGGPTIKPDDKALLAGDMCFVFADELLNGFSVEVKKQYDILREEVIAGEWMDTFYTMSSDAMRHPEEHSNEESSREDSSPSPKMMRGQNNRNEVKENLHDLLMQIYRYKTVSYTILQPFMMGFVFFNKNVGNAYMRSLQQVLINIGLAFQMQDDYLDLFGDARLGKKIGGDLKEGKLTIWHAKIMEYFSVGAEHVQPKGAQHVVPLHKYMGIFGNPTQSQEDIEYVKQLMIDSGVKKEIEQEMQDLVNSAKKEIEKQHNINSKAMILLKEMAEFVIRREY